METSLDRISDLPSNVLVNILACLPLQDAVKTSTLSKKWRKKWQAMPRIIIQESTVHQTQKRKLDGIINYVLSQHEGKIQKCSIVVNQLMNSYSIKSWIRRLSQKYIQELTLVTWSGRVNEVPSDLFSCQQLRKLKLRHFEFKSLYSFKGFLNLTSLHLYRITMTTGTFESLICSCPLLEKLTVQNLSCVDHFHINVPKLMLFLFDGKFKSIHFNAPLRFIFLNSKRFGSGQNVIIHGLPHSIEVLFLNSQIQKFLVATGLVMDSTSYGNLKNLILLVFCFEKVSEVASLISFIGSLPNLQGLDITACDCKNEPDFEPLLIFWEEQMRSATTLNQLREVKVSSFHGEDPELWFIRYILASSPSLKKMTIEYTNKRDFESAVVLSQLMHFPRASTEAEVRHMAENSDSSDAESSDYFSDSMPDEFDDFDDDDYDDD